MPQPRKYATHAERQADACPTLQALLDDWGQGAAQGESWPQFIAHTGATLRAADQQLTALCRSHLLFVLAATVAAELHPQRPRGRRRQIQSRLGTDLHQWWEAYAEGAPFPDWAAQLVRYADIAPTMAERIVCAECGTLERPRAAA